MVNGSRRMHKQILLYFFFTCRLIGNYFLFRTPMSKSILPYRNLLDDPVPSPTDWRTFLWLPSPQLLTLHIQRNHADTSNHHLSTNDIDISATEKA